MVKRFLVGYNFRSPSTFLLFEILAYYLSNKLQFLPLGHLIALVNLTCWKINLQWYWHLRIISAANVIENCYIALWLENFT